MKKMEHSKVNAAGKPGARMGPGTLSPEPVNLTITRYHLSTVTETGSALEAGRGDRQEKGDDNTGRQPVPSRCQGVSQECASLDVVLDTAVSPPSS